MSSGLLLGVVLVAACIANTRLVGRRLSSSPNGVRRFEQRVWALGLPVAALIYVGFALRPGGQAWMPLELGGLLAWSVLGGLALRWPPVLALGWLLHGAWDGIVHGDAPAEVVPAWYRWACLSFDGVVGIYLAGRFWGAAGSRGEGGG